MNDKKERLINSIKHLVQMLEVDFLSYQSGIERLYGIASHYQEKPPAPKKEEPKVHLHGPFDGRIANGTSAYYSQICSTCKKTIAELERKMESPKEDDPELLLTVGQMKELFDNLVYAGFTNKEALFIVAQVARK